MSGVIARALARLAAGLAVGALLAGPGVARAAADGLVVGVTADGLATLQHRGRNYALVVKEPVAWIQLDGADITSRPPARSRDVRGSTVVDRYDWGSVTRRFAAAGDTLTVTVAVHNAGAKPLVGYQIVPFALQLPSTPAEYDGKPMLRDNVGGPSVLALTHAGGRLVLANEDVVRPLLLGLPWPADRPISTQFPVFVTVGRSPSFPTSVRTIARPIGPQGTDEIALSVRFGAASEAVDALAADVLARFRAAFPRTLFWPDRRPIGQLILANSGYRSPANPRGWLAGRTLDIAAAGSAEQFRAKTLELVDTSIALTRRVNAQGVIVWDAEGQELPHAISYIGDPRLVEALAPEMREVVDAMFARMRAAGLRVGVGIRPQEIAAGPTAPPSCRPGAVFLKTDAPPGEKGLQCRDAGGWAPGLPGSQPPPADPVPVLLEKIAYAKRRWGATVFYVDSNTVRSVPYPAEVFKRVADAHPDVLLIPEHEDPKYYAWTAPYHEYRRGIWETPADASALYPGAFSVINITLDGPEPLDRAKLGRARGRGDILLYPTWFRNKSVDALEDVAPR